MKSYSQVCQVNLDSMTTASILAVGKLLSVFSRIKLFFSQVNKIEDKISNSSTTDLSSNLVLKGFGSYA